VRQPLGLTRTFDFVRGCFTRCKMNYALCIVNYELYPKT